MGLQPRDSRLASRQSARRSSNPNAAAADAPNALSAASPSPKSTARRRLSVPTRPEEISTLHLPHVNLDPRLVRPAANNRMAASSPRRPARYSTGDVPSGLRNAAGAPGSPRRPNRHSVTMSGGTARIKEETSDGEDDVDGAATTGFDISRLASSPKPPRRNKERPLRHSVCLGPHEAAATARNTALMTASTEDALPSHDRAGESAAELAADRKQKRVRFSVPNLCLTEEQLQELTAASTVGQDRENQLAAPCSDTFRKAMLDMQFLSLETGREETAREAAGSDSQSSSSPSADA